LHTQTYRRHWLGTSAAGHMGISIVYPTPPTRTYRHM
jgi:hypothetical protein